MVEFDLSKITGREPPTDDDLIELTGKRQRAKRPVSSVGTGP